MLFVWQFILHSDKFCNYILTACIEAGIENIPFHKIFERAVPGWKEYVKPEKVNLLFWH